MKYSYEDSIKISQQALDLIDVKKFLISGKDISDIKYDIRFYIYISEDKVKNFISQYSDIFGIDLDIFNYIEDDEFINYCKKRYPDICWGNEIIERHWVI
jgi:hypothetical protein